MTCGDRTYHIGTTIEDTIYKWVPVDLIDEIVEESG